MKKKKLLILAIHILMLTQTYFFLPLIPIYAKRFGIAQFLIGQIIFFYNLPMGFTKIYIGYLIDKIGSKNILILSNIIFIFGLVFYLFPENFIMLSIGQFLTGTCRAAFMAATSFYFSEMDENSRGKNLGIRTAGIGMGFFIGPILGSIASDLWGYYAIFYILFVSFILNFIIIFNLPALKKKIKKPEKNLDFISESGELLKNLHFLTVILSGFTISVIMVITDNYLPLYLDEIKLSIRAAGIILSIKGVSQIIFGPIMGSLSDKYGRNIFVYLGISMPAVSILLIPFLQNFWVLITAVFFVSLGFTVLNPILNALAAEATDFSKRGFSIGIWQSSVSFATTIFALVFGYVYSYFNLTYIFIVSSVFLFISLISVYYVNKKIFASNKATKKLKEVSLSAED